MTEDTSLKDPDTEPTNSTPGTSLGRLLMFSLAVNPAGTIQLMRELNRGTPRRKSGKGKGTNRMRRVKTGKKG